MNTKDPSSNGEQISITIAASFTADLLEPPLRFWMEELRQPATVEFVPYGQFFQQFLTSGRSLPNSRNEINVTVLRLEDWGGASPIGAERLIEAALERNLDDFLQRLRASLDGTASTFIVCLCPPSEHLIADSRTRAFISKMETALAAEVEKIPGVHVLRHQDVAKLYPVSDFYDAYSDKLAHVPYTAVFFTGLGTMIARKIHALRKLPHKVLVLDCDGTLWSGVCAEDGPAGVEVDSDRRALQQFVLRQHAAGMILCLCSKNSEEDVQAVFDAHPGMLLRRDHFLASRINWRPKSENLRSLAHELNLGLDSFILIDDDAVECGEVKANCPDVLAIRLPPPTESLARFLDHLWVFDRAKATDEGNRRTELYRENFQRDSIRKRSLTFAEFLAELELKVDISPAVPQSLERVSDLTYRTNQFNLSTIRRSASELRNLRRQGREILVVQVRDRFGDYGLVGVVIFEMSSPGLVVDTFLLSCRAMGRGVEHKVLAHLGKLAADRNAERVELRFVPTSKNKPAHDFLESLAGAQKAADDGGWRYQLLPGAAAECRLDPESALRQNDQAPEAVMAQVAILRDADGRSNPPSRDDFLLHIAVKLNDAKTIHEVISSFDRVRPQLAVPFLAPSSEIEKQIAGIWSELLGFDQIGVNDDFFDLGGHSLMAMQVLSRIRSIFDVELSPRLLVTGEFTVAALSKAVLMEQIRRADTAEVEAILSKLEGLSVDDLRDLTDLGDKK
jgi:FkbH-like protein